MPRQVQRRFALKPVMRRVSLDTGVPLIGADGNAHNTTNMKQLAPILGFSHRALCRWASEGGIPLWSADRVACALGYHPVDIWPDWFEISVGAAVDELRNVTRRLVNRINDARDTGLHPDPAVMQTLRDVQDQLSYLLSRWVDEQREVVHG